MCTAAYNVDVASDRRRREKSRSTLVRLMRSSRDFEWERETKSPIPHMHTK